MVMYTFQYRVDRIKGTPSRDNFQLFAAYSLVAYYNTRGLHLLQCTQGQMQKKLMAVAQVNVHFSILDEYERRMNETSLAGFGADFPRKFENVRPPQM